MAAFPPKAPQSDSDHAILAEVCKGIVQGSYGARKDTQAFGLWNTKWPGPFPKPP